MTKHPASVIFPPSTLQKSNRPHRTIYRVVSGNVFGVVEEPEGLGSEEPVDMQRMVKIGVLNSGVGINDDDTRHVIHELRAFCTNPAARVILPI